MIYGTLTDFISGQEIVDTDDERYRQKLARFLVDTKGYAKGELEMRLSIETLFAKQFVTSKIDIVVTINDERFMLLRYGPGSIVTRERPAIAAARVLDNNYQIPLVVVTNGEDAEILDTYTGKEIYHSMAGIPDRDEANALFSKLKFTPLADNRKEKELRILNAFDVEI